MCGIVATIGDENAYPILIKGLQRLEYRGYDSAGVAMLSDDGNLNIYKSKGKVSALEQYCNGKNTGGTIGIAHTRWATHGDPTDRNAHPHVSADGKLALVHNGTIENYAVLKQVLSDQGVEFKSDTDTEVLVQLIAYIKNTAGCSTLDAVAEALRQVVGAYAIAVVDKDDPDTLIAARKSSPMVIGIADHQTYIASDASPIVDYTDRVVYPDDDRDSSDKPRQTARNNQSQGSVTRTSRHTHPEAYSSPTRKGRVSPLHAQGDIRATKHNTGLHKGTNRRLKSNSIRGK